MNWIKIEDGAEMPGDGQDVLIHSAKRGDLTSNTVIEIGCLLNGVWVNDFLLPIENSMDMYVVTHWAKIEPPKQ